MRAQKRHTLHFNEFIPRAGITFRQDYIQTLVILIYSSFQQDVWQYFLNLTQANLMDTPDWLLEYKATEDFNISDVSPQSLHDLVQTFKPQGSFNFLKYYLFNSVSAGGEDCDEECKTGQLCGMTEVDFDQYDACLQGSSSSTVSSTSSVKPSNGISVPSGSSSVKFCFSVVTFWLMFMGILL